MRLRLEHVEIGDENIKVNIRRLDGQERDIAISLNADIIEGDCVGEIMLE